MAEQDDGAERSHDASPERLRRAREKGDVLSSPEVQTLARYAGLLLVVAGAGGALALTAAERLSGFLSNPLAASGHLLGGGEVLPVFSPIAAGVAAPLLASLLLVGAALLALRGVVFAPSKLKPDVKKISPVSNAKQKFGAKALKEFARTLIKTLAVVAGATTLALAVLPRLLSRVGAPGEVMAGELGALLNAMLALAVALSLLAAAADLPARHAARLARLKMTRQEVADETKESEGSPERRSARRKRAQELLASSGLNDVPKADVVIVNPEHYAVALAWNRKKGELPRCVAKGTDHVALAIRQRATLAGVPIRRDPPTARALHASVSLGEPIRREHFAAVAAAIRFADKVVGSRR